MKIKQYTSDSLEVLSEGVELWLNSTYLIFNDELCSQIFDTAMCSTGCLEKTVINFRKICKWIHFLFTTKQNTTELEEIY